MNCRYCGSTNAASDHRCQRCGRRLHLAAARPAPDTYPVAGALAPEPRIAPPVPTSDAEAVPESAARRAPYQPALFTTRDLGRIVPIEAYKQRAAERRERAKQAESAASAARQHGAAAARGSLQADLPFTPTASGAAAVQQRTAEARYSKAPVAIPVHRMMAAAIDFGMVTVAAGVICLSIFFGVGEGTLPGPMLHWFGGLAFTLSLLYKLLWAALEMDSPGLRWCHLKLLHFDGRPPARRERMARIAWSLLSLMAGGLGLIWALVDEEHLSWHDHSSKTFLTPYSAILANTRL